MLITLTTDFHLTTLPGVEDVTIISVMVLRGVSEIQEVGQIIDSK
jgi:hypothetical protein